ncbi:membrane protein implicated in regulation of membrane protease activity [Paraburkholderia youngii]
MPLRRRHLARVKGTSASCYKHPGRSGVFCFVEVDVAPGGLFWWIGAGVLVVLELMSGTFYLLMIAFGFVAAALARIAGAGPDLQFVVAALVALAAVVALRRSRFARRRREQASRNPDVNLDIGQTLNVPAWQSRKARATYRGAAWDVELAAGEPEDAQVYEIRELRGSCLVVVASRQPKARASAT